jgi:hypothetical protein
MKYFIENVRPRKFTEGSWFDDWDFWKGVMYEVKSAMAYDLYVEAAENEHIEYETIDSAFEAGERVYVDKNSIVICGIEMSDEELFKARLEGKVGKGIFK